VECAFESLAELFARSSQHHLVEGSSSSLNFVTIFTARNLLHKSFVKRAFESVDESSLVCDLIESVCVVGVKVADLADVLLAFLLSVDAVCHASACDTIWVDLNSLTVRLKFKQVTHHRCSSGVQLPDAEVVKFVHPDLLNTHLNLEKGVVSHSLWDKLGVDFHSLVGLSSASNFVKEFSEINADWQVDEHILV